MTTERMINIIEEETTIELYNSEWEDLEEAMEKILREIEDERSGEAVDG